MIPEFYEDCEIFVTGGSGVVGKALIEKLLRSTNVRRIYILLRPKRDFTLEDRLKKLRADKMFRVLNATMPDRMSKVTAVPGDAKLPNLGITKEWAQKLDNVSIIFHCAATVRFDEPLKEALNLNVGGTWEALKFAETLKKLKIFMHVSTFFSNPYLTYVDSKLYPSPMYWKLCVNMIKDDSRLDEFNTLTKKIITGFPNTYTFTKNLAENCVNDYRKRLPVAIYRPSIVLYAIKEPEPSFPPSLTGAVGLFAVAGAGVLKTVYIDNTTHLDVTPLDMCTKSLIYYAVRAGNKYASRMKFADIPIYMTSSWGRLELTFKETCEVLDKNNIWDEAAFEKNLLIPGVKYTDSRLFYMFWVFILEILPCLLGDLLMKAFGRKPALMSVLRRTYLTLEVMQPFMFNNFTSPGMSHIEEMEDTLRGTDFDITDALEATKHKNILVHSLVMGRMIREILLNEDPKTIPRSQKIMKIKIAVYNVIRAILAYYLLRWFYRILMNYIEGNFS